VDDNPPLAERLASDATLPPRLERAAVAAACLASLVLGLFFIFVWTPLPWGWKGIDFYYEIALSVAHGEPFPTMHRVWGYIYFLAFFYRLFGDRQWIPLCVQALLNAAVPLMLYHMVRITIGGRVAVVAALLAGVLSFNTVYASTQASDSLCTVVVVATMLSLTLGDVRRRTVYFVLAGALASFAYQLRPNFVIYPLFVAGVYLLVRPRTRQNLLALASFLGVFVLTGTPWVIRNYQWSGLFVPASTHGGVQLWFGTLQSGAYQDSWLYNPRAAFEYPPVDYTSLDEFPIIVTAEVNSCAPPAVRQVDLLYWTNHDRAPRRIESHPDGRAQTLTFTVPRQPSPSALYYFFETRSSIDGHSTVNRVPGSGDTQPLMTVVSRDHLGDLDVDDHVLDIFDIVRMVRHVAWHEALAFPARLDLDGDRRITERDVRIAVAVLLHERVPASEAPDEVADIDYASEAATVSLRDGSGFSVPRRWSGRLTDVTLKTVGVESMVALLVGRSRPFGQLDAADAGLNISQDPCLSVPEVGVNRVPYRRLPHEMRRFTALALDNIRQAPRAFVTASLRRAVRVFIIAGSDDTRTAYQFNRAGVIYAAGWIASVVYLALFLAGLIIALVRRLPVALLLTPIAFVPITICIMLITARYSMATQPFMFAFVAIALVSAADAWRSRDRRAPRSPR
jgi:hypothetical protein